MEPLINGVAYDFTSIEVRLFNVVVAGIRAIEYTDKQAMSNNPGAGKFPVSRSYGKYEATAKITLEMAEVVALQKAVPTGRLQDIPEFSIPVAYAPIGGTLTRDTIHNCRFMTNGRSAKTGEAEGIAVELELIVSHITWGA